MRRIWWIAVVLLLAGCGVRPSGVTDGGEAPTGVAPGVTLYFVDAHGDLRPQLRPTRRLGSISEALALLLDDDRYSGSGLHSEIGPSAVTRVPVSTTPGLIHLELPITIHDVTPLGIEQIVCTTLAVEVQGGGPRSMKVQLDFTLPTRESDRVRTCPLIK